MICDFKNKRTVALFVFFVLISFSLISQIHTFKSPKIRINDYGNREQTATISPSIITLNLQDSLISIQSEHLRINEFLGYQNQFEITQSFGSGVTTKVYLTSTEYIFTFDTKVRLILISKRDISPKVHSVWFEEIVN